MCATEIMHIKEQCSRVTTLLESETPRDCIRLPILIYFQRQSSNYYSGILP